MPQPMNLTDPNTTVRHTKPQTFVRLVSFRNASPYEVVNGQTVTFTMTAQTGGAATLTYPDFAGVSDTFVFNTLAATLANKTLSAPVLSGTVTGTYSLAGTPTLVGTFAGTPTFSDVVTFSAAGAAVLVTNNVTISGGEAAGTLAPFALVVKPTMSVQRAAAVPVMNVERAQGTYAAPTDLTNGLETGRYAFVGRFNSTRDELAMVSVFYTGNGLTQTAELRFLTANAGAPALRWTVREEGDLLAAEGINIRAGTVTGTKFGTATTQRFAFYNATPIGQGAAVADAAGGATIDAEARTAINALLARIRSFGVIAT